MTQQEKILKLEDLKKQIEDAGGSIECSGKFPICGIAVIVLMLISIL